MKTIGLVLAVAMSCAACSQGAPAASSMPSSTEAEATPEPPKSPVELADDVLQARLRKAAAEYDGSHSQRDPEEYGFLGVSGGGAPPLRSGPGPSGVALSGRRPPEVVQRIVRQNFGRFRFCYEQGLLRNPTLEGKTSTTFVILPSGAVKDATTTGDLPDERR